MEIKNQTKPIRAVIDCPVCFSGNIFYINQATAPLVCDDCEFALAGSIKQLKTGACIFCGNREFYEEASLIPFSAPKSFCYVCEAEYTGIETLGTDKHFDEEKAEQLRSSKSAVELKERVEFYNQQ